MCCGYSRALQADTVLRSAPGQGLESDGAEPRRATAVRSNCVITTLPNRCGRKTKAATRSRVGRLFRACSLSLRRGRPQRYSDSTSAPRRGVGITCCELRHLPGPWFGVHGAVWPPATVARANAAMPRPLLAAPCEWEAPARAAPMPDSRRSGFIGLCGWSGRPISSCI
jgi:hypothetical protein